MMAGPLAKATKARSERERLAMVGGATRQLIQDMAGIERALDLCVGAREGQTHRAALVSTILAVLHERVWYRRLWRWMQSLASRPSAR